MALSVDDDDVVRFAEVHTAAASEIHAGCQPDPDLIAAMTAGYGPAGAEFVAAVAEFQAALLASGEHVAHGYEDHATALRAAAYRYVAGDQTGAQGITAVNTDAGGPPGVQAVRALNTSSPGGLDWEHIDDVMDFWENTSSGELPAMPDPYPPEF